MNSLERLIRFEKFINDLWEVYDRMIDIEYKYRNFGGGNKDDIIVLEDDIIKLLKLAFDYENVEKEPNRYKFLKDLNNEVIIEKDKYLLEIKYNNISNRLQSLKQSREMLSFSKSSLIFKMPTIIEKPTKDLISFLIELRHIADNDDYFKSINYYNNVIRYILNLIIFKVDKIFTRKELNYFDQTEPSQTQPTPPQNLTFNSRLNDKQIDIIVDLINDIKLFDIDVDKTILNNLLDCNLTQPLSTNTTNFTHLFNELSIKKLITNEYQSIVSKSKLFKGTRGRFITDKNLSSTLQKIDRHNEGIIKISNAIKSL
jgi:hypothetical protein